MTLEVLMQEAAGAVDAGDLERAEPLLLQIVQLNPRDAEAWHMLAVITLRGARSTEAIEFATRAHQLQRRNHLYLNTMGVAHAEAGRLDDAVSWFNRALKERPSHAESHFNLGKAYGKLDRPVEAERCYVRARQLEPGSPRIANSLGALYSRLGRYEDALPYLSQARSGLPDDPSVAINSALARLANSGPEAAISELSEFVGRHPDAAAPRAELGRRLLAEHCFAEGWQQYAWRHGAPARGFSSIDGKRVLLLPDQGLGDQLFFLRFVPLLRQRAAHVAFACPPQLRGILDDDLCRRADEAAEFDVSLSLGDLPRVLEDTSTPPPLPIRVEASCIGEWRDRLATLAPGPYLGVTWRAGSKREHEAEFAAPGEDPLYKEIAIELLASAIRGWRGSVLILQRLPQPGENEMVNRALGRMAHDLSAVNEDLAEMAALLSLIDDYVGVSNTNMHVRAGIGKSAAVLVPFPPEFRWMHSGDASPWFPGFAIYRQAPSADWSAALRWLRNRLNS
jgi:Flp pilus assembly protein TadD